MAASSVRRASEREPINSLDEVRTSPLKARLPDQSRSVPLTNEPAKLTAVVKDALQRRYGSLKAASLSMTPRMDEGQLSRELQTGDFKFEKLERLDVDGQAFVAKALHEALGDVDPKSQARRLIREARARLDELAEVIAS